MLVTGLLGLRSFQYTYREVYGLRQFYQLCEDKSVESLPARQGAAGYHKFPLFQAICVAFCVFRNSVEVREVHSSALFETVHSGTTSHLILHPLIHLSPSPHCSVAPSPPPVDTLLDNRFVLSIDYRISRIVYFVNYAESSIQNRAGRRISP